MIKPIAFYLPQFHETEENNKWWGKGFTEWTSVRRAEALYQGHCQPREPLNGYYYNLLEKETMMWQAELAKKYKIYGFCMYHYWFKDGRKLLEKPAENLLEWNDIDINFCFSWANESWIRTWSNMEGNDWNECQDQNYLKEDEKDNGVLVEQDYGDRADWVEHFNYLLPFFRDKRYIKVNNAPMFLLYRAGKIDVLPEMLCCWNELAVQNGFSGIYVLTTNDMVQNNPYVKGLVKYEPRYSQKTWMAGKNMLIDYGGEIYRKLFGSFLKKYDYDKIWKNILKIKKYPVDTYPGAFVSYDDTPRRGKNGAVYLHATPERFAKYFHELTLQCRKDYKQEFIFINAWNEWAEGAYLEPDTINQFQWLEGIKKAVENE